MAIVKNEKKFYTSYSKLSEVQLITIGLASPKRIKQWAEKTIPNGKVLGEVINANTLHHKTFKPQKGGLFCERIFGPLKDFECACGKPLKHKKNVSLTETPLDLTDPNKTILGNPTIKTRNFCNICDVEYTWSVMRRYQLGYINLISPVTHVWYLKSNPSYLSILLDIKKRHLEHVTYCSESLTIENALKGKTNPTNLSDIVSSWNKIKEQIMMDKIKSMDHPKALPWKDEPNDLKNNSVQVKIQKRKNLKIKKQNYWKKFYVNKNMDQWETSKNVLSLKTSNLTGSLPNTLPWENLDHSSPEINSNSVNSVKNYFHNINLFTLFQLFSTLQRVKRFQRHQNEIYTPKQVLDEISIPFYILLKLRQNYNILPMNFHKSVWVVLSQKALKKSLIQINAMLKKIDSIYFNKISIKPTHIHQDSSLKLKSYDTTLKSLKNELETMQLNSSICLKIIKKSLSNLLDKYNKNQNDLKNINFSINNNQHLLKTDIYLKFYTLSNFSNKHVKSFLLNKSSYDALNFKPFNSAYKILFENLTEEFFKIALKNSYPVLKKILDLKIKGSQDFESLQTKLNKPQFIHYLRIINGFNIKYKEYLVNNENFEIENSGPKSLVRKNEFNLINLKNFQLKKSENQTKKLYNNFYCLSHRERWEGENDWNFFYYFLSSTFEAGPLIANYKNRHQKISGINSGSAESNSNLSFSKISSNLQKTAFFSGPGIIQQLLREFNFYEIKKMDKQNRMLLYQLNKQIFKLKPYAKHDRSLKKNLKEAYKKRDLLIRRTKLIRKLFIKESDPESIILSVLPVLPPDLRPIVKMGGQVAASDLNRLYQRVIYRNDRLKKFLKDPATSYSYEMKYAQRLLQEAVDNLIQNGKGGVVSEKDSRGRSLKSLSDILKGKQGRFRQYLLGKRVDYSGRSVIVVGPKLKLHECGIPKEMAQELYLPFLLKRILNEKLAKTVVGAKSLINKNPSLTWELLREIMQTCPVLLNRAPTLHRLGIQSFQPKLIEGRAILLHPLVCSAFNADFDGDQMAVHIPITVEARAEAWKLMLSRNNILSPATGDPLMIPSQDMVLGCYYLTTNLLNKKTQSFINSMGSGFYYSDINHVLRDYDLKKIHLHANIWLKWTNSVENGADQEEPIEIRVDHYGNWNEIYNKNQKIYSFKNQLFSQYILTTPGKILFNKIIQKCLNI